VSARVVVRRETEKNLAPGLHEAERARAVLFLHEAESLLGKRTNAIHAHDRYAKSDQERGRRPTAGLVHRDSTIRD
jgi:hypothetical protein